MCMSEPVSGVMGWVFPAYLCKSTLHPPLPMLCAWEAASVD